MHRLSGEDSGFLTMDLPGQPMNSMVLGVLEPGAAPLTVDELRAHIASRLDQLPSWRWLIARVPGDLHHPVAWTPGEPDLEFHVQEISLLAHGGPQGELAHGGPQGELAHGGPQGERGADATALESLFAALAEGHLATDRPLWRVWLVNDLDGNGQAVVLKYHHALADGVGAVTTLHRLFSDAELPAPVGAGPLRPEQRPGRFRLLLAALWAHLWAWLTVLPLVLRTRRGARAVKERRAVAEIEMPPYSAGAPRTLLNDAFMPERRYVRSTLPLADVKEVKEATGVTLNDVVLAVVAGAALRYLARYQPEFDPTTSRPLLTTVPMSNEAADAPVRQYGNRFWSFTTSLATDVADPWERLQTISRTAAEGKAQLEALGPDLVPDWLDRLPPRLAARGVHGVLSRLEASEEDADASILVSNMRGPVERFTLGGRTFSSIHCDGPPSNGVGINVMVWSYGADLALGILGYAGALAHPAAFAEAVQESFAELRTVARTGSVVLPAGGGRS